MGIAMGAPILWAFGALACGIAVGDALGASPAPWGLAAALLLAVLVVVMRLHRGVVVTGG